MSDVEQLTKLDAAKRQLNTAIRIFFEKEDPIAVHALAAGAMQIIADLGAKRGLALGIEAGIQLIKPERQKEFRSMMREPQNHIKHADREGDETRVLEYRPATIEFYLYFASSGYQELTGTDTPETRVVKWWFVMCNPNLLNDVESKGQIESMIERYGDFSDEDKDMMSQYISRLREEQTISDLDYS